MLKVMSGGGTSRLDEPKFRGGTWLQHRYQMVAGVDTIGFTNDCEDVSDAFIMILMFIRGQPTR